MNAKETVSTNPEEEKQQRQTEYDLVAIEFHQKVQSLIAELQTAGLEISQSFVYLNIFVPESATNATTSLYVETAVQPKRFAVPTIFMPHAPDTWKTYSSSNTRYREYHLYMYSILAGINYPSSSKAHYNREVYTPIIESGEFYLTHFQEGIEEQKLEWIKRLSTAVDLCHVEGTNITVSNAVTYILKDGAWQVKEKQANGVQHSSDLPSWLTDDE